MTHAGKAKAPAGITISGTGMCIPPKVLTNADLAQRVDTSDEWIVKRTGIRQRHVVDAVTDNRTTWQLATEAVTKALDSANLAPTDLDLLICATMSPEMNCPATACRVVDAIGATPCGAFDLSAACTGFVAALNAAHNFLLSGHYRHIAVVGAETMSRILNWEDRNTCILFGDAASAAIVSTTDDPNQGCIYQTLGSDGSKWNELYVPRVEQDLPPAGIGAPFNGKFHALQMNGREIFRFAVTKLDEAIDQALNATGLNVDQIKVIVPHQSNIRILKNARDRLELEGDKLYINIDRYGNTSAASVGICLNELIQAGALAPGDIVLFAALGGGLAWGTSVWQL